MEINDYQRAARRTSLQTDIGGDYVVYPLLGLMAEAGELANKIKKIHRDNGGQYSYPAWLDLKAELGDILWYVAELASQMNFTLEDVAASNLSKLADRQKRGAISGNGDAR